MNYVHLQGALLINTPDWRIIRVTDPVYPGFCRVVWNRHVAEMTDLGYRDQLCLNVSSISC